MKDINKKLEYLYAQQKTCKHLTIIGLIIVISIQVMLAVKQVPNGNLHLESIDEEQMLVINELEFEE
jgi:hypothetical protein